MSKTQTEQKEKSARELRREQRLKEKSDNQAKAMNEQDDSDGAFESSAFPIPETFFSNNAPITICNVDGKDIRVLMLSSDEATLWSKACTNIERLEHARDARLKAHSRAKQANVAGAPMGTPSDKIAAVEKELEEAWSKAFDAMIEAQAQHAELVRAQLMAYEPETFTDELLSNMTPGQIYGAYIFLRQYNDPFVVPGTFQLELANQMARSRASISGQAIK